MPCPGPGPCIRGGPILFCCRGSRICWRALGKEELPGSFWSGDWELSPIEGAPGCWEGFWNKRSISRIKSYVKIKNTDTTVHDHIKQVLFIFFTTKEQRMRLLSAEKEAKDKNFLSPILTTLLWSLTKSLSSRVWTVKRGLSAVPWGADPAVIKVAKGLCGLINRIYILFGKQADCLKHTCIWCCWRKEGHQGLWQLYTTAANWYNCSLRWNMSGSFLQNNI